MKGPINFSSSAQGWRGWGGGEGGGGGRKCDCRRWKKSNCWQQLWFHQDPEPSETGFHCDERCNGDAGRHIWGINWEAKTLLLGLGRRDEKIWGGGKKAWERLVRSDIAAAAGRDARKTLVRLELQRVKINPRESASRCKSQSKSVKHLLDVRTCHGTCALVTLR